MHLRALNAVALLEGPTVAVRLDVGEALGAYESAEEYIEDYPAVELK